VGRKRGTFQLKTLSDEAISLLNGRILNPLIFSDFWDIVIIFKNPFGWLPIICCGAGAVGNCIPLGEAEILLINVQNYR